MKKINVSILVLLITILFITSCATTVTTSYMVPAKYDMSNYRSLAITSAGVYRFRAFDLPSSIVRDMSGTCPVRVYSGFSVNSERKMSEYLTSGVVKEANQSGYFTILSPSSADNFINIPNALVKQGYEAHLSMWTEDIGIDEFIFAKEERRVIPPLNEGDPEVIVTTLAYYLEQNVTVQFGWEVKNLKTGAIIASDSFRDTRSSTTKITTDGNSVVYAPRLQTTLNAIASSFATTIIEQLVPTTKTRVISLMKNDPKSKRVEIAYDLVKDGNFFDALDIFENEWKKRDHIPSAYNAALLLEALDQRDDAIKLLEKAYKNSGNQKIRNLLEAMNSRRDSTKQAESQL